VIWRPLKPEEHREAMRLLVGPEDWAGMVSAPQLDVRPAPPLGTLAVLHHTTRGQPALLLDLAEPARTMRARVVVKNRPEGGGTEMVVEVPAPGPWRSIPPDEPLRGPGDRLDTYCTARQAAQREQVGSVCIDEDCDLSGGYAHVGPCEPCGCGLRHAVAECPATAVVEPSP
jgi:hypothetical protein